MSEKSITTKKGREYLYDRFFRIRSKVLSCGIYRTEEGNSLVRVTMKNGKHYDFPGKKHWHCKIFAREFRRRVLNIYI